MNESCSIFTLGMWVGGWHTLSRVECVRIPFQASNAKM